MYCLECGVSYTGNDAEARIRIAASPVIVDRCEEYPTPDLCPRCREQVRLAFRNERCLYRSSCALSGKSIISVYRPDSPYLVFDQEVWWSDAYDPLAYGREFDFSRPFFEQFFELFRQVPKLAIQNAKSENCLYTNYSAENRNCYLLVGGLNSEDCYYGYRIFSSRNVLDSFGLTRAELCYECVECSDVYNAAYATDCHSSFDITLCENLIGCKQCFGCVGLRNCESYLFNRPAAKSEIEAWRSRFLSDAPRVPTEYENLRVPDAIRELRMDGCEACSGNQLAFCVRCHDSLFLRQSQDVHRSTNGENNKDCVDCNFFDNCELQYFSANLEKNYRVAFASLAWYVSESDYVISCFNSKRLFGCVGMKRNEFCILNMQYSPSAYQELVPRIILHMRATGEWGKYFPAQYSPFSYFETVANERFPLSCETAHQRKFRWQEEYRGDGASSVGIACVECGKPYRIINQEASQLERMGLRHPDHCPDCRHRARMKRASKRPDDMGGNF